MQFSLKRLFSPSRLEKRSTLSAPAEWLINSLTNVFGAQTSSGQAVNTRTALSIASVHACVRVISDGLATLDLKLYEETDNGKRVARAHYASALVNEPNPYQTKFDFLKYQGPACA